MGLYGLVGAGRTELARAIIGVDKLTAGEVVVGGRPATIQQRQGRPRPIPHRLCLGESQGRGPDPDHVAHVERVDHDLASAAERDRAGSAPRRSARPSSRIVDRLDIKAPSLDDTPSPASAAATSRRSAWPSGWRPAWSVLIIDEPTVGIDVRTKANLHELIWELVSQGLGHHPDLERHAGDGASRRSDSGDAPRPVDRRDRQHPRLRGDQRSDHEAHPLERQRGLVRPPAIGSGEGTSEVHCAGRSASDRVTRSDRPQGGSARFRHGTARRTL